MTKWSVEHKSIVVLLAVATLIAGFFAYQGMERQENPSIVSPAAVVKCIYPGASPEDVEKLIIKPIEDELGEISEIKKLTSFAMDSIGIVKISLKDMSDEAINETWDDVKDKIDTVKSELPEEAAEPIVDTDFTSSYGMILGLSSDVYSYEELSNVARKLKDKLSKDPGIESVDIDGEVHQEIQINLDMLKLSQYGLSPQTIVNAIKARNVNIPGGTLEIDQIKAAVQISGEYQNIEEIQDTIVGVSTETGTPVYLRDVAEIVQKEEKLDQSAAVKNKKALLIGVKYMDKQNILDADKRIESIIEDFKKEELYQGMELTELTDQAGFVESAISLFEDNLYSAIILVLIVVFVTMGIRSALIVSVPIPIVVAMVFVYMKLTEIPLHQVSIASMIICLSLLVANGIVANDNMHVYLEKGSDRLSACTKGIEEVKIPILTSTLTTVASFLPLAMMQGTAGKFVKSLPILVTVALLGSYITSLTVVPAAGYKLLKSKDTGSQSKRQMASITEFLKINRISKGIVKGYGSLLKMTLKMPFMTILIFIGIFVMSLSVVPSLGMQLFPPVQRDQYVIELTVKDGSTVEKTQETARAVGQLLEKEESIESFAYKVGDGLPRYYVTFIPNDKASNKAQFLINGDISETKRIEKELNEKVPGAQINIKKLETASPVDYPVQIRIYGDQIDELRRIAEEIKDIITEVPGQKMIEDNYGYDSYKLSIKVNEEKANLSGITNYDVASTVRMAVNGAKISSLKQKDIEKDPLPIMIKIPDEAKKDGDILDEIFLTSQITGKNVPIGQLAEVQTESSLNKIVREDGKRMITVGVFIEDDYTSSEVTKSCKALLSEYKLPEGYNVEFGGADEERSEAFTSMVIPSILAAAIIYLILVLQFGDLREPLIIMGTIPLSFIGIIWGLKWTGYPIGFMALLGAISLMGVVVNNGIVLLDYIKIVAKENEDLKEAIVEACKTRMRPIIIGMVTTIISLIPLARSGGELWAPMANAINFGMLVSSVSTLFVIPCAYFMIEKRRMKMKTFFRRISILLVCVIGTTTLYATEPKPLLSLDEAIQVGFTYSGQLSLNAQEKDVLRERLKASENSIYEVYQSIYLQKAKNENQKKVLEDQITYDIMTRYTNITFLEDQIAQLDQAVSLKEKELRQMKYKKEEGMVTGLQYDSVETELEDLENSWQAAQDNLENESSYFKLVTGKDPEKYTLEDTPSFEIFRISGDTERYIDGKIEEYLKYDQDLAQFAKDHLIIAGTPAVVYADYLNNKYNADKNLIALEDARKEMKDQLMAGYATLLNLEKQIESLKIKQDLAKKQVSIAKAQYEMGTIVSLAYEKQKLSIEEIELSLKKLTTQYNLIRYAIEKPWAVITSK